MQTLEPSERAYLRQFMVDHFDLTELKDLAFDLGIDYDSLPHATDSEFCRELIAYYERTGNLPCLLIEILKRRPDDQLVQLLTRLTGCTSRKKIQIILPGDRLQNKADLLAKVASLFNVAPDEIMLIGTAPGSIRVLISLPGDVVQPATSPSSQSAAPDGILSITPFEALDPATQEDWRRRVVGRVPGPPAVPRGGMRFGLSPLGVLATIVGIIVVGILASSPVSPIAPVVTIHNQCRQTITIPIVGSIAGHGQTSTQIFTGPYAVDWNPRSQTLNVSAFLLGQFGPYTLGSAVNDIFLQQNGHPIPNGQTLWATPGARFDVAVVCREP